MSTGNVNPIEIGGVEVEVAIFLESKIYRSGDNSCKNRCSQLEKKTMTDLYEILKCILITVTTKVCIAKTVVFSVIIYG